MTAFFNAISAVLVLFMLMAVGYFMGWRKWMGESEKNFLSKYIINIAVPCTCITGILNNLSRDMLIDAVALLAVSFASVVIVLIISAAVAKLLKLPRSRWGVFVSMCGFSNTIFIGLPMATQLLGDSCIPYVMIYYLASTILVQTVGIYLVQSAGRSVPRQSGLDRVKDLFTKPPVLGVVAALVMLVTELRPPEMFMNFAGYIGGSVSPMALIYCGYLLYQVGIRNLRFLPGIPLMLVFKLVLLPCVCWLLCLAAGVKGMGHMALMVESGLPVITQLTVMAGAFGADEQYALSGACLSILGSFITLPVMMLLIS